MGNAKCVECGEDTSYCFCNPSRNRDESLGFHLPDPVQEYRDLRNKKLPSDLENQDFSFTRLPKKKLKWKNMSGANLTRANLTEAILLAFSDQTNGIGFYCSSSYSDPAISSFEDSLNIGVVLDPRVLGIGGNAAKMSITQPCAVRPVRYFG